MFETWSKKRRIKAAAEQMWKHIQVGVNFEVPLNLDASDPTMLAIAYLQQMHPKVVVGLHQSRGLVVGLHRVGQTGSENKKVAAGAWGILDQYGHFANKSQDVEHLLAGQEKFIRQQGLDPREEERVAQEKEAARTRIEVGQQGTDAKVIALNSHPSATPVPDPKPTV